MTIRDGLVVPEGIKSGGNWKYARRHPERRKQTQIDYYQRNKEALKAKRRARYAAKKALKLAQQKEEQKKII